MHTSNVIQAWRSSRKGYGIIGSKCANCKEFFYPEKKRCPKCESNELESYKFKGAGQVYSYSIIHHAPAGMEAHVPYAVAIIKLDEGPKITAQLADIDLEKIGIGMKVESCIRKIHEDGDAGLVHYGVKFRGC